MNKIVPSWILDQDAVAIYCYSIHKKIPFSSDQYVIDRIKLLSHIYRNGSNIQPSIISELWKEVLKFPQVRDTLPEWESITEEFGIELP